MHQFHGFYLSISGEKKEMGVRIPIEIGQILGLHSSILSHPRNCVRVFRPHPRNELVVDEFGRVMRESFLPLFSLIFPVFSHPLNLHNSFWICINLSQFPSSIFTFVRSKVALTRTLAVALSLSLAESGSLHYFRRIGIQTHWNRFLLNLDRSVIYKF